MSRISRRGVLAGAAGGAFLAAAAPAAADAQGPTSSQQYCDMYVPTPAGVNVSGERKLIDAGWDMPGPQFMAKNAAAMQEAPFDGLVFNLWETKPDYRVGNTWSLFHYKDVPGFTEADIDIGAFTEIKWTSFTDNLISANPCPFGTPGIDFFSDAVWEQAQHQVQLLGKVLRASAAKGIWFDPEGGNPGMQYSSDHYPGRTFEQVANQARVRGSQFMDALQREKRDIRVLFTFLGSLRYDAENASDLATTTYGLLKPFATGMLEAQNGESVIIDGSENDYYKYDSQQYVRWRQWLEGGWYTYPPGAQEDYAAALHMGSTVYADAVMGVAVPGIASGFSFYDEIRNDVGFLKQWTKHDVYNAMLKADDYVWMWNEKMSWWHPEARPLPEGMDEAVREARGTFNDGAALGYDMCRAGKVGTPAFVASPTINLETVPDQATGWRAGDTLALRGAPAQASGAPDVEYVTFYHNDRVLEQVQIEDWRTAVRLAPGTHTFHAVGFNADGTHCSSNPLIINAG